MSRVGQNKDQTIMVARLRHSSFCTFLVKFWHFPFYFPLFFLFNFFSFDYFYLSFYFPPAAAAAPLSFRLFWGYLLLLIVPRLFPFRHVARRNVARAIDWSEKKRTRNASLHARNSGLWRCGARDFFFLQIKSLFVNFHKTNKLYNQIK